MLCDEVRSGALAGRGQDLDVFTASLLALAGELG